MSSAEKPVRIQVTVGDQVLHASLDDRPAGRAFAALLPLTVSLSDHAGTEKISDLPARLPTEGSPPGTAAQAGDLAYYAPWGNLACFYQPFQYSQGLVTLGRLDAGIDQLAAVSSDVPVTFTLLEAQSS
jgi:hypothetical protein